MEEKNYKLIMQRTGEAWRQLEFAKPFLYESMGSDLANKICRKFFEAQLIIFEAESLLPDPYDEEAE